MFGFMEKSHDHDNYIHSLDTLLPVVCLSAIAPSYARPFLFASAIFSPSVRRALKALDHIAAAARGCVAERQESTAAGKTSIRRDLLHQLLEIAQTKGEKVDFGVHEVEYEAYVGLYEKLLL